MRARTSLLIDAAILAVYLVATNPVTTGTPLHERLGVGIAIMTFAHLVFHWRWVVAVSSRLFRRINPLSRLNLAVDVLALVAFVAVTLSGLAVSRSLLARTGRVVTTTSPWHAIHSGTSTLLLVLVGVHLGLHWSWMTAAARTIAENHRARPQGRRPAVKSTPGGLPGARGSGRAHIGRSAGGVCAAAAVTISIAGTLWLTAPAVASRVTWLVLPGGLVSSSTGGLTAIHSPGGAMADTRPTAGGFSGSQNQRIAVRASHSLVVLGIPALLGAACHEILRTD